MEAADFAVRIEEVMTTECSEYECVKLDENEIGRLWSFVIEDIFTGYIGLEDNEESIKIPTVTMGLNLKDVTQASREELQSLLMYNCELVSANFGLVQYLTDPEDDEFLILNEDENVLYEDKEPEMRELLVIQTRIPFDAFVAEDFSGYVQNLIFQADMLPGQQDDEDGEAVGFDSSVEIID